jgi:hypothetical protein
MPGRRGAHVFRTASQAIFPRLDGVVHRDTLGKRGNKQEETTER